MAEDAQAAIEISLVISDVDGTLVTTEKVLTPRAAAAVHKLASAGIAFAVTSSRPPRGLAMLIEPLALVTPLTGFNGGVIAAPDMTVFEEHLLDPAVAQRAVALVRESGLEPWVFTPDAWIINDPAGAHVAHEEHTVQFPPVITKDFGPALDRVGKIVGVSNDHALVARGETTIKAGLGAAASVQRSQLYYLDITHPQANKGAAVVALSRRLGIPSTRIATIGDGDNDVAMFHQSGLSIAMGNASAEVKAQAHFTTLSNEAEGFADAMERIILPKARRR